MATRFKEITNSYMEEFRQDLADLVACRSVRDTTHACKGAPFGPGIASAFGVFLRIADRCGFECRSVDGYACEAQAGSNGRDSGYIGILGHLDVVEEGARELWSSDPFRLTEKGGIWYGRGVNDDKGPLLASLYAVRILKDMGMEFKRNVRIIAGGAEETTWECMEYYFRHNRQPVMGFSPDGNFPVVNGEKGILKYALRFPSPAAQRGMGHPLLLCGTLENYVCDRAVLRLDGPEGPQEYEFTGKRSLSRNPQRGDNALWKLAGWMSAHKELPEPAGRFSAFILNCLADDYYGAKSGLYASCPEMGQGSVCPTGAKWDDRGLLLYLDIRYTKPLTEEELAGRIEALGKLYGFLPAVTARKKLLYVPQDSELIRVLSHAYESVTGSPARPMTKGGASYARVLDCGIAFGASFDGEDAHPHMPDECMSPASLQKAMEIYCEAILGLAGMCQELPQ